MIIINIKVKTKQKMNRNECTGMKSSIKNIFNYTFWVTGNHAEEGDWGTYIKQFRYVKKYQN